MLLTIREAISLGLREALNNNILKINDKI